MTRYDVIVVGAGPAGTAAAYDLAKQKMAVLLLDKARFPRMKACAGGLTVKAVRALRYPIGPVIRKRCCHMVVSNGLRKDKLFRSDRPVAFMTNRPELDAYSLGETLKAGAVFISPAAVEHIRETSEYVDVLTTRGTFRAPVVIGADGANSRVRKICDPFPTFQRAFAIEAQLPGDGGREMMFDFHVVKSGYGWVFPKADHINIGVYTWDERVKLKADDLVRYCLAKTGTDRLQKMTARYIGLGGWGYVPDDRRVLLVGDAAGLADPLLGEGLHNAIKSGQAAARAIVQARHHARHRPGTGYHREIAPIKADVRAGYWAARWFYRFPAIGYTLLTFPAVRNRLMAGFARGLTLSEIVKLFLREL